jgi:hypothetical protein
MCEKTTIAVATQIYHGVCCVYSLFLATWHHSGIVTYRRELVFQTHVDDVAVQIGVEINSIKKHVDRLKCC